MILYIDTFISEIALCPNRKLEAFLEKVQQNSYVYRKQSKINIFRYSAASYTSIPWSKVILRIDGDIKEDIINLKEFLEECFPGADLLFERNDTGLKYASVLDGIRKDNPWVFFSPNNDHPFIYKDAGIFDNLISAAEKAEAKNNIPNLIHPRFLPMFRYLKYFKGHFSDLINNILFKDSIKKFNLKNLKFY